MKKLLTAVVIGTSIMLPAVISAQDFEFSANVALTNDYKYYGFSQSSEGWAVSGGFDFAHDSGFYLGTWASTIDFNVGASDPAQIELDVYGGYGGEFSNGLSYDLGVIRYGYPNQSEDAGGGSYEYWEFYANFEYAFSGNLEPTLAFGVAISPDFFGETGTSVYPNGGLSITLPNDFGAYINIGYLDVDDIDLDYFHYQIGINKEFAGLGFDLAWADADDDCGGDDFCEGIIFTVSKEF